LQEASNHRRWYKGVNDCDQRRCDPQASNDERGDNKYSPFAKNFGGFAAA